MHQLHPDHRPGRRSNGTPSGCPRHQRWRGSWCSTRLCFVRLPRPGLFFNRPGTVLMRTNDGAVDHGVLIVSIAGQMGKHRLQDTALRPPAKPPMHILPIAKPFRQISPGNTRAISIQHCLDKKPVISRRSPYRFFTSRKQSLDDIPLSSRSA